MEKYNIYEDPEAMKYWGIDDDDYEPEEIEEQ